MSTSPSATSDDPVEEQLPGTRLPGRRTAPIELSPIDAAVRFALDAPQVAIVVLVLVLLAMAAPETAVALKGTASGAASEFLKLSGLSALVQPIVRSVLFSLTAVIATTAIAYSVAGRRLGPVAALRIGAPRLLTVFAFSLIWSLLSQPLGLMAVINAGNGQVGRSVLDAVWPAVYCLLLPATLYASIRFVFVAQAICLARQGLVDAFKCSWLFTRGRAFEVLLNMLAVYVPAAFVWLFVVALAAVWPQAASDPSSPTIDPVITLVASLPMAIAGLAQMLVFTFLWFRIRGEIEGLSLDDVVTELPR